MKAISTKYLTPTDRRGARIKATAEGVGSVTIDYPHDTHEDQKHKRAALALCKKAGWKTEGMVGGFLRPGQWAFVWSDRASDMEQHLRTLVAYITSGDHYETKNPYTREPVVAALEMLASYYGGDWTNANDGFVGDAS